MDEEQWEGGPIEPTTQPEHEQYRELDDKIKELGQSENDFGFLDEVPAEAPAPAEAATDEVPDESHFLEQEVADLEESKPFDYSRDAADAEAAAHTEEFPVTEEPRGESPQPAKAAAPQSLLEAFQRGEGPGQQSQPMGAGGLPKMPDFQDDGSGGADLGGIIQELADEHVKGQTIIKDTLRDVVRQIQAINEALERMRL